MDYRYQVLQGDLALRVRDLVRQVCERIEIQILRGVVSKDHVHILVSAPPEIAPSEIMRRVKGRTSSKIFEEFPMVKKRYWGRHFWARGYFDGTWAARRSAGNDVLGLGRDSSVPDHSSLSRTRSRLPLAIHQEVFTWVLKVLSKDGLILGGRIGVDASTMEANAALKTIVRRDTGESYRKMLLRMAKESGIEAPTDEDLARMDRKRTGKTLSNKDWESPVGPEAKITKMKDGRTHLAYKPEHAVDLDTGAVVAVKVHEADKGDTTTLTKTLEAARESLGRVTPTPPCPDDPAEFRGQGVFLSRCAQKPGRWSVENQNRRTQAQRPEFLARRP